jgi:PAS domain S-box-containing protein
MDVFRWINAVTTPDPVGAGAAASHLWPWVTIALSALVVAGYVVIAVNWYFQSRLARGESRASMVRLCWIVLCCAVCGYAFRAADIGWGAWRLYDAVLLLIACHTWTFALRMRGGLRLVDERLAQVDELERSAEKYREIAELLPQVVWTATAHGVVDFSNRGWLQYADRPWTDAVHPEESEHVAAWWQQAVAGREPVGREVRLVGSDGESRTFVVRATPVIHGECVKWLGACADVEDQKRIAAERERQAQQKTFFLNALSHDLRAPLHNVVLNAHLLKMSARGGVTADPAEVEESVDMIVENAVAAGDLVAKLLDFARAGEDRNAPERVPLAAMVQQIGRRFVPVAEQKGLTLRVSADPHADEAGRPEVFADRQKLERIVSNLLDNAIKFTDRGGVGLELVWRAASGETGDDDDDREVAAIRVFDSGVGIPPASIPYLFDEFYQVNNHERDRNKGFGIGLAICRSLARQLGGDVRLVSTGPTGSCFEVTLSSLRPGRRGRPDGAACDRAHPEEAGLCRV